MKTIIISIIVAALAGCAAPALTPTSKNYVGSYDKGGCNSGIACQSARNLDEGLGGTGGGL